MSVLYLECNMGVAGDMLLAALTELQPDPAAFVARLNGLEIPSVTVSSGPVQRCGITATHLSVAVNGEEEESQDVPHDHHHHENREPHHDHEGHHHDHGGEGEHHHHHHAGLEDVKEVIQGLELPEAVKADACAVYDRLAGAEARAHNTTLDHIHFHEVGTMDAVADIVGVCLALHELAPEEVVCSPICVGYGQVRCAHGILPVPAPATAELLRGIPAYSGDIEGELCTPTGAALVGYFATRFDHMPEMRVERTGYGAGKKEFPAANLVRVSLGQAGAGSGANERVVCLSCNLDDITGEALGHAMEVLREAGAKEVYALPAQMKKNRPGHLLSCICAPEQADELARLMLKHTTTLGVRRRELGRYALNRETEVLETEYGPVRVKKAWGYGVTRKKPEAEDVARIAKEQDLSFDEVEKYITNIM